MGLGRHKREQVFETEYNTLCCKAGWYVKSKANFRCKKCDRDVTLELLLLHQSTEEWE